MHQTKKIDKDQKKEKKKALFSAGHHNNSRKREAESASPNNFSLLRSVRIAFRTPGLDSGPDGGVLFLGHVLELLGKDMDARTATGHEQALDAAPAGFEHGPQVFQHRVGDGLHEGLMVAEGEHVELEALGFHAQLVRDVLHGDGAHVRLSRHRAQGRELGKGDADDVRTLGVTVGEGFQQRRAGAALQFGHLAGPQHMKVLRLVLAAGGGHENSFSDLAGHRERATAAVLVTYCACRYNSGRYLPSRQFVEDA